MPPVFSIPIRVYYEDTDAGQVVYHANYVKFMERARTEWLRARGFEQDELMRRDGILFAVRSAKLDFLKPARFNDLLQATVQISQQRNTSIIFSQQIRRDELSLCEGEVKIVCLDAETFTPCPIPAHIKTRLIREDAP